MPSSDRRLKSVVAVPVHKSEALAIVPALDGVDQHLVSFVAPQSPEAEQYRTLRYAVEHVHKPGECTVIGVCSALPGDGKSITAINLAGALAQDPRARVLLMEADLRRPSLSIADHLALGDIATRHGLVDAILDLDSTLEEVVRYLPNFNLALLLAGRRANAPYEMLTTTRFGELITQARQQYDYVILDTPPVVPVPDCRLLQQWVDGFIMVVAAHRTPREALEEALTLINPANILGLVFNGHDRSATRHYGYGYGYGNGHAPRRGWTRWWNRFWGM